jgi:hydroxymethylpyrimidine pyrophosphatase-like HAD family hydrolase
MEPTLACGVSEVFESMGHAALALQDTQAAGFDYLVTAEVELNEATRTWMEVTAAKVKRVPRLSQHPHEHTIRIGIVASRDQTEQVRLALEHRFAEGIVCHSLYVPSYGVEVLEVFDPSVNKWEGIQHIARRHGIAPEQIVAIGDDVNDIAMVSRAGLGVAMGNAKEELKRVAKRVINRNDQDGLAEFLEELVASHAVEPEV